MVKIADLRKLVFDGARSKKLEINDLTLDRLSFELSVIEKLSLPEYFIIYSKIVEICNKHGLLRSYGRGSACGSLVNYCLDITKINPLKEGLIFERFLNPLVSTFADIDIDIPKGCQKMVYEELKVELPAHIICFLATLPSNLSKDYKDLVFNNIVYKKHPCGVIILSDTKPISVGTIEGTEYYFIDDFKNDLFVNHSKYDILELDYLNRLELLVNMVGKKYHPYNLPIDDEEVFDFFKNGELTNIFQFSSHSVEKIMSQFTPDSIYDLSMINAMFRPGPMGNIPHLINNKLYGYADNYPNDKRVQKILGETYGMLLYQETFIRLLNEIAGISLMQAEIMRKKLFRSNDKDEISKFKRKFVVGCKKNCSLNIEEITHLAQMMLYNVDCAFQKSHSLSYSIVAYWGAYYKTHFKKEFEEVFKVSIR